MLRSFGHPAPLLKAEQTGKFTGPIPPGCGPPAVRGPQVAASNHPATTDANWPAKIEARHAAYRRRRLAPSGPGIGSKSRQRLGETLPAEGWRNPRRPTSPLFYKAPFAAICDTQGVKILKIVGGTADFWPAAGTRCMHRRHSPWDGRCE